MSTTARSKANGTSTAQYNLGDGYHHPAVLALPATLPSTHITPALVEALLTLYDSNYSLSQFEAACQLAFHPAVHMSCAACQVRSLPDLRAVYAMQRCAFTRFAPRTCHVCPATDGRRVVLDMDMEWTGAGGRVTRSVGTLLRATVDEEGKVVELEEVWSLNDRLGAWLTFGSWNLFDGLRWTVTRLVMRYAKWRGI